jgi:o-succinylbenzoate synthase
MGLQASFFKKIFKFGFDAHTSRGRMNDKTSWFVKIWSDDNSDVVGIGECAPLPGLSIDAVPDFENELARVIAKVPALNPLQTYEEGRLREIIPSQFPAITFGMETAMLDLINGGKRIIYKNDFIKGVPIPINGLVWMGDLDFMRRQVDEKIELGFQCIKLKIGGLDFDSECELLRSIRNQYREKNIQIRLDANGAFSADEVMSRLNVLSEFDIHSIEQPIPPGLAGMESLCQHSPIPIALDEELIGKLTRESKLELLHRLKPAFIVLKPMLHGGLSGCREWITLAEQLKINWWITSSLESSIGLNAICQFTANYSVSLPQGLGTGTIYENNIKSPLSVSGGRIFYDLRRKWDILN